MTDPPPTPTASEAAFAVPGGWVHVTAAFTAADNLAPADARAAADHVRAIDPQMLRDAVNARTRSAATDIFAVALDVIAAELEGQQ